MVFNRLNKGGDLVGRVIVYTKFSDRDGNEEFVAMQGSVHEEYFTDVLNKPKEQVAQLFDIAVNEARKRGGSGIPFVNMPIFLDTEEEIQGLKYDVFFAGEFPDKSACNHSIADAMNKYIRMYREEQGSTLRVRKKLKGMVNDVLDGKLDEAYRKRDEVLSGWRDKNSRSMLEELCDYVLDAPAENRFSLDHVGHKYDMIMAVKEENYERAAEFKEKFEELPPRVQ